MNQYEKRIALVEGYLNRLALPNEILEYYRRRSILVTGGAGAIGSNLIIGALLSNGSGTIGPKPKKLPIFPRA